MNLNGFMNLDYQHHSGDMYTLICVGDTFSELENGEKKRTPHAVYRKHSTGEIFIRPMAEFDQKFNQKTVELEEVIDQDFTFLKEKVGGDEREFRKRRMTILGMGRALWMLFPMVSLDARIGLVRALNFCDYVSQLGDDTLAERLSERYIQLARHLHLAGATLSTVHPNTTMKQFENATGEENLSLLMLGLASSWRAYTVMTSITKEVASEEERDQYLLEIQTLIESIEATAQWMNDTGISVALPKLEVKANLYEADSLVLDVSNSN